LNESVFRDIVQLHFIMLINYSLLLLEVLVLLAQPCCAAATFAFVPDVFTKGIDSVGTRKPSIIWTHLREIDTASAEDSSGSFSSPYHDIGVSDCCRSRRSVVTVALCGVFGWNMIRPPPANAAAEEDALPVLKTSTGLKYIDLVPGTGISPSYGNLVSIAYTAYVKLPANNRQFSTQPQRFDHSDAYLIKHGNGRMIAGLDEGIHTMKVGGTRRILIPPKLGFVDIGLGPLPDLPWNRYALNRLLDQMVELSGGTVIYEVTLRSVIPDEADLGYYSDASLSPEDFATLRENLRAKGNEERLREQAAAAAATTKGQDRML
jgi:FKBP-type peptidyl-prolyl cis-trans isomerase